MNSSVEVELQRAALRKAKNVITGEIVLMGRTNIQTAVSSRFYESKWLRKVQQALSAAMAEFGEGVAGYRRSEYPVSFYY